MSSRKKKDSEGKWWQRTGWIEREGHTTRLISLTFQKCEPWHKLNNKSREGSLVLLSGVEDGRGDLVCHLLTVDSASTVYSDQSYQRILCCACINFMQYIPTSFLPQPVTANHSTGTPQPPQLVYVYASASFTLEFVCHFEFRMQQMSTRKKLQKRLPGEIGGFTGSWILFAAPVSNPYSRTCSQRKL